jgi:hypothetical protein
MLYVFIAGTMPVLLLIQARVLSNSQQDVQATLIY